MCQPLCVPQKLCSSLDSFTLWRPRVFSCRYCYYIDKFKIRFVFSIYLSEEQCYWGWGKGASLTGKVKDGRNLMGIILVSWPGKLKSNWISFQTWRGASQGLLGRNTEAMSPSWKPNLFNNSSALHYTLLVWKTTQENMITYPREEELTKKVRPLGKSNAFPLKLQIHMTILR